jgi:hypothetical protein
VNDHVADPLRSLLNAAVVPLPLEALPRDGRAALDPEAGRVAVDEFRSAVRGGDVEVAVVLACLAYQRRLDARRAIHSYTTAQGVRMARQHSAAVADALAVLRFHGGEEGPRPEDAMAHALATAEAWWERHIAEERAHERRRESHGRQIASDLADARRRAAVRVTVSGSQR